MASNYCYMFNCHKLLKQLKVVIKEDNGKKLSIFRVLVAHFGRIISSKKDSFVGELALDSHHSLLKEIEKCLFIKVRDRKKYPGNDEVFVVFFTM